VARDLPLATLRPPQWAPCGMISDVHSFARGSSFNFFLEHHPSANGRPGLRHALLYVRPPSPFNDGDSSLA
jgi:hypothetical protein